MKKLLLAGIAISAITFTTAQAHADTMSNDPLTGPYIGAYGGYGWSDGDNPVNDIDLDGGDYGIYAGMKADTLLDSTINQLGTNLTGALEVYYGWSGQDETIGGVSLEKDHEYGVRFLPGLGFIDEATNSAINPYGIIGYKRANYEANVAGATSDETYDGFELGIGTELIAYDNMGVRLDYAHTWYGEEDGIDPSEDNVRLGLSYQY